MIIKSNAGKNNTFTEINIAHVKNVNPNVKEVRQVINVGKPKVTAADRGMAEEIIINLRQIEEEYQIDLTKEKNWVLNKVQKEE